MKRVVRRSEEASRNCPSAPSSFPARGVRYLECQKNHAAAIGGYAVDGCREFMASSAEEGSQEAFLCAACGCHRSFHRRHDANAAVAECTTSPPNSSSYC